VGDKLSSDNYIVVDNDGDVFQIYEGSMSAKLSLGDYEPILVDTADDVPAVELILGEYSYTEYGTKWTDAANRARTHDGTTAAAVEKVLEKLVNLANKLDEHMKERDAHNPAMMYRK
jgi:hypothetical protein